MTAPKVGDRVHVEYDGVVCQIHPRTGFVAVRSPEGKNGLWLWQVAAPAEHCTVIRPPLAVGDTVTRRDPEPPLGTILVGPTDTPWQRKANGWVLVGDVGSFQWNELLNDYEVLRVGAGF